MEKISRGREVKGFSMFFVGNTEHPKRNEGEEGGKGEYTKREGGK